MSVKNKSQYTQEFLLTILDYCPDTGILTWKDKTADKVSTGARAGYVETLHGKIKGRKIKVRGERHHEHKIIFVMVYGRWPEHNIVHLDGDRTNNRLSNIVEHTVADKTKRVTHSELKDLLHYDPTTGIFRWRVRRGGVSPGDTTGCEDSSGHLGICLNGRLYLAHRLAWFYVHGEWPEVIDHVNGDRKDNRLVNLRDTNITGNAQNTRAPRRNNRTGYLGVVPRPGGKFRALIGVNGEKKNIGHFDTPEEAHEAYKKAKRELHPTCTI